MAPRLTARPASAGTNGANGHSRSLSGLYLASGARSTNGGAPPDELRVDVDGVFPQMAASGMVIGDQGQSLCWMARIRRKAANTNIWSGPIKFKEGRRRLLLATRVVLVALAPDGPRRAGMEVTFLGQRVRPKTQIFRFESPFFHTVDFEFDRTSGAAPTLSYKTGMHPNRPPDLRDEKLTVPDVFKRAGFAVTRSAGGRLVPMKAAGDDALWNDQELNDAMESFRAHRTDGPQWRLWVFTTGKHEGIPVADADSDELIAPERIGGVMFDYSGALQRQGAAIFNDSYISKPRASEGNPRAWARRQRFFTTCHEMAHSFNLAHSGEKSRGNPFLRSRNDREARSFMNYPHSVKGGEQAFYQSFAFRFTDSEILFLRHAPAKFVQMGNAAWLDGHGFVESVARRPSGLALEVRVNRDSPTFSYLEPITIELKLTNESHRAQAIDRSLLHSMESLVVVIRRKGSPARRYRPFARYHFAPDVVKLRPGESIYTSAFISSGTNGWLLKDPGTYSVSAVLRLPAEDLESNKLKLLVQQGTEAEQRYEKDYFSLDVGRVLAFDGSRVLTGANATLARVADELPGNPVSIHAKVALACARATKSKRLEFNGSEVRVVVEEADDSAFDRLREALVDDAPRAIQTLGHIDYKLYMDWVTACLHRRAEPQQARLFQQKLYETMCARRVRGKPIRQPVLESIEKRLANWVR